MFKTMNLALKVAVPPSKKSCETLFGKIVPFKALKTLAEVSLSQLPHTEALPAPPDSKH
jgi:hypothetical protein